MDNIKLIIDRFEGEYAVCEHGGEMINIARVSLPKNAAEGDVLVGGDGGYRIDNAETEARRERARELHNRLFKK